MITIPFKFIHCADLHLDSPFEGLHSISPKITKILKEATFKSFENIINLAIQQGASFVVIAGDIYDGVNRNLRTQWRFHELLREAGKEGIKFFISHGNHDPLSDWEVGLNIPENVHRFGRDVDCVSIHKKDGMIARVYGISYHTREIKENLASRFSRRGDEPFAVGVLHCNVGGSIGHNNYAPCTVGDLINSGMDYWALGHIHIRQTLNDEPHIIYSGNTQGRSVKETGKKGCYLVSVDRQGYVDVNFFATDVVRWYIEDMDITNITSLDALINKIRSRKGAIKAKADGRSAVIRLQFNGRGDIHSQLNAQEAEILASINDEEQYGGQFVWLESLRINTHPPVDIDELRRRDNFIGEFLRIAESLRSDTRSRMLQILEGLSEHKNIREDLISLSDDELMSILDDAELKGLESLLDGEG